MALRPVAGEAAFLVFGLGIVGTVMLAIPVLAGSAAYAVSDAMGWRGSLEDRPALAPRFYAIVALSTLAGIGMNFAPIDPIMAVMMLMVLRTDIMGSLATGRRLAILGWLGTLNMACAVAAMLLI